MVGELDAVLGPDGPVDFQALREIPQTEYAVKDALRLHPPLFMLLRKVMQPFEVLGHRIPPGWFVVNSPTVSHRIEALFQNADRFDPQRFAPPREEDRKHFAYLSFGAGRHRCMGNAFAIVQIKTIFAVLLRRDTFELTGDPIVADFDGLVIGPRGPCRVRYRRRT